MPLEKVESIDDKMEEVESESESEKEDVKERQSSPRVRQQVHSETCVSGSRSIEAERVCVCVSGEEEMCGESAEDGERVTLQTREERRRRHGGPQRDEKTQQQETGGL